MPKKVIILTILVVLSLLNANSVSAMCVSSNVLDDIKQATAIFAGKVTNIEEIGKTTFIVSQIWKGQINKILTITNINGTTAAGGLRLWVEDMPTFELNEEYLVYAVGSEDNLQTYICSPTKLLADAQDDLNLLGQGQIIKDDNDKTSTDNNVPLTNRINFFGEFNLSQGLLVINIILLLIVVLLLIRKRNNSK